MLLVPRATIAAIIVVSFPSGMIVPLITLTTASKMTLALVRYVLLVNVFDRAIVVVVVVVTVLLVR